MAISKQALAIPLVIVFGAAWILPVISASQQDTGRTARSDSAGGSGVVSLDSLERILESGKPSIVYFYHSVACSCTAARCSLAAAAIDSVPSLKDPEQGFNFMTIDSFYEPAFDSLYAVEIVPAIVYYDRQGSEVLRYEWEINGELVRSLLEFARREVKRVTEETGIQDDPPAEIK